MSITLQQNPQDAPIYGHPNFILDSTNKGKDGFTFVAEITVDNPLRFEFPVFNNRGYFNPEDVLSAYTKDAVPARQKTKLIDDIQKLGYTIQFFESYLDSNGNQVENPWSGGPLIKTAYNAVRPYGQDFKTLDLEVLSDKSLTARPYDKVTTEIYTGQPKLISLQPQSEYDEFRLQTTDTQGNPISENFSLAKPTVVDIEYWYSQQSVAGGDKIFLSLRDSTASDPQNIIYKTLTFEFECVDKRVEPITLAWLNNHGGIDSFTFTLRHTEQMQITRDLFLQDTTFFEDEQLTDRGFKQFGNAFKEFLTLNSNWILNSDMDWLKYVFTSPQVFMWYRGDWHAVIVNQEELQTKLNQKLFNAQVNVQLANNQYTSQKF